MVRKGARIRTFRIIFSILISTLVGIHRIGNFPKSESEKEIVARGKLSFFDILFFKKVIVAKVIIVAMVTGNTANL